MHLTGHRHQIHGENVENPMPLQRSRRPDSVVSLLWVRIVRHLALQAVLVTGALLSLNAQSVDHRIIPAPTDTAAAKFDTDDGPHLFWVDDTVAHVIYFCDGAVVSRAFANSDSLRFNGFCHDTNAQYLIAVNRPPAPDQIDNAKRILAVSDIHGDYTSLTGILMAAGVVDSGLRWTWGDGHLVIVGDVFDRGPSVTECLWLIYRLEQEAATAGGTVHYVLGNHELMILRGDLRYVHDRYTQGIARRSRFAYDDLYGTETELGRWLRTKPTILRLNRTLFVHGGVLPEHLQTSGGIGGINSLVRQGLDYSSLRLNFDEPTKKLYGSLGPLWYRGYTQGIDGAYGPASAAQIDSVLRMCGVDFIVVGHTEHDTLCLFHDGKVIAIDVDVETLGEQQALLWQDGLFYRMTQRGERQAIHRK